MRFGFSLPYRPFLGDADGAGCRDAEALLEGQSSGSVALLRCDLCHSTPGKDQLRWKATGPVQRSSFILGPDDKVILLRAFSSWWVGKVF